MSKQLRWIGVLILLLALAALACNAIGGDNNPAANNPAANDTVNDTAAETPDDSGTSTDTPADDTGTAGEESEQPEVAPTAEGPETLDMAGLTGGLETFTSYRVSMVFDFESVNETGEPEAVHMTMESDRVMDPPASRTLISIESTDEAAGFGTVEMIVVDGMAYTTVPGLGCFAEAADDTADEDIFEDFFGDDFLGEIEGAERVMPDEVINGVDTYHFVFDEEDVEDTDNEIEELDGHIYVAKEGGYVVRLTMDGTGRVDVFDEGGDDTAEDQLGTIHVELNTSDVNQPIDIQPPADCSTFDFGDLDDQGGAELDAASALYPVIEQNQDLFTFEGILTYQTETPFDEVVSFYQSEMPTAGFTPVESGSIVTEGSAILQYTQNDSTYYVTISESDGIVDVLITPE